MKKNNIAQWKMMLGVCNGDIDGFVSDDTIIINPEQTTQ